MSTNMGILSNIPADVLQYGILYPLSRRDLYRFSQVSKGGYLAIQNVAQLPQHEISLIAKVTLLKDEDDKSEGDTSTFRFTTLEDLSRKVEEIGRTKGVIINPKLAFVTLEEAKEGSPFVVLDERNQTVSALLLQRFKVEALLKHASLLEALPNNLHPRDEYYLRPKDVQFLKLPVNQPLDMLDMKSLYVFPLLALFDFHAKNYSTEMLGRVVGGFDLQSRCFWTTCPELVSIFEKAIFIHPNAKDISSRRLAEILVHSRIGVGSSKSYHPNASRFDILGPIKGEGFYKKEPIDSLNVDPPHEMIEAGKIKNLAIAKLVFTHPNAANIQFRGAIGNLLLCAVRNRSLDVVQMILDHPDAKNIKDAELDVALNDAQNGEEQEIAKAIGTFKEKRTVEKSKQVAIEEKNAIESAISEIVQAVTAAKKKSDESEKDEKCTVS